VVEKTYDTCWAADASAVVTETIKVFLDGQFWLDSEFFGPDQVAFARGMDAKHVNCRSWKRETKRNVVANFDKHVIRVSINYVFPLKSSAVFIPSLKKDNIRMHSEQSCHELEEPSGPSIPHTTIRAPSALLSSSASRYWSTITRCETGDSAKG
jgi:hypothetical protein